MPKLPIARLPADSSTPFPDVELALDYPNGLLAAGGDLSVTRLLMAYQRGIFPWFSHNEPILWWSPDPRLILYPDELHIARSLRKAMARHAWQVTFDRDFLRVINHCAATPRPQQEGTWITADIVQAYHQLHLAGYAHSVECWLEGKLVGGLYGVVLGEIFFGESMFSHYDNASKIAFVTLIRHLQSCALIDCQVATHHLISLGARAIPRQEFTDLLSRHTPGRSCWPTLIETTP
jgi:leucyl/phenylalanyl-tRNA---protein transferase